VAAPGAWWFHAVGAATALSFLLVSVAYFGTGPRLLFKRANGRRFLWAWLVHWPNFALTAFTYPLTLLMSRENPIVRVAPNVLLGRRLTEREAERVARAGVVAVLDLAAELPEAAPFRAVEHYRSVPVLDAIAPRPADLREAVAWVQERAAQGAVYVHCALGHGRSALVVAAYLIASGQAPDAKAAVQHLRALRPSVKLRSPQRAALEAFARQLAGASTLLRGER
jgi:protein-tyrosine phosphatase